TTPPHPYRPFRHGPNYFITMGLLRLPASSWITLDSDFPQTHTLKTQRLLARPQCIQVLPSAIPAVHELCHELSRYVLARYPTLFTPLPDGAGMRNTHTGEEFNFSRPDLAGNGREMMKMVGKWVQDDVAVMMPDEEGRYRLVAGAVLLPGFWRIEEKVGLSLDEIHEGGSVPGYERKLKTGMNRFFERLRVEDVVARHNYFIQVDDSLPWSHSIGNEDGEHVGWFSAEKATDIEKIHFRSERQSLRRLPKTGAIIFTIRTYFLPITEIVKEPYVPGRLASAIRSWDEDVARYKGRDRYEEVLLPYLDKMHRKQVEEGLEVEREEEVVKYPF
ncbi:hypothetical protein EX30DRAFT_310449, partial [Ascodesmis nigricans]